ncbi:ABC transporter ATP-binding protein [Alicyclobacillus sp. SO9]|uniref:ABC transporter ATP-binding protein n=1 Tax=Alicyclobacillus sp. SO9 TaxID=2665646 RepID=UPI0018E7BA5E|nr:ABC transporter ATP-binding protein [Alicyclobacillus sp. SO9]QQE80127.1 ABC transporter ATP-binding protein [Alicyclobacillus sp. SO9]
MNGFLEVRDVTKTFPGVVANDKVNLTLQSGEVHAILGENGAGKSTLMKLIYGLYQPDSGDIRLEGKSLDFQSPRDAIRAGIGMVHQHFMLIPALTVAENIVLGAEPGRIRYRRKQANQQVRALSEQYKLTVDPTAKVGHLSVGLQQRVEILKALFREAKLLILDEPTALLTPQETRELFEVVRHLRDEGIPILFISHKLDEVKEISNRVTVMRAGQTVETVETADATPQELANLMVGREVVLQINKKPATPGAPVISVKDLWVQDMDKHDRVRGVSFDVKAGEVFGLAGIDGNGQFELVDAIAGLARVTGGEIRFDGKDIRHHSPAARTVAGIAYVPQDRQRDGLILDFSLVENSILRDFRSREFSRFGFTKARSALTFTKRMLKEFDVRPPIPERHADDLSGGNQQKVILAREVSRDPKLMIAAQPTRGLDVGAIEGIHKQLIRLRDEGRGVLLVSLELDEILSLSDRIGVIHNGELVAIVSGAEATREKIGLLMTGVKDAEAKEVES